MTEAEYAHCLAYALRNILKYPDSSSAKALAIRTLDDYFNTPHYLGNNAVDSKLPT